ncbi:unnamed protein product, partial [Polarella glacialis]
IFLDLTSNRPDLQADVLQRLKGPMLTLMAAANPELAYTVLMHISAIVNRSNANVEVFKPDFKQFFCRYNEPSYIKTVKIDILTMLADANSAEHIVTELSEYVTDVDAMISRQAIRAIGKIAVNVASTADLIVSSLTSLLELDIDYVCTEAAVVMKDLVRKYPQQFESASGAVERCLKIVTEPEGKCAVLWILGEYGLLIEDAPYLLEPMIDGFMEEQNGSVRLEMLTAAVKLFFSRPPEMQKMLGKLLQQAIQESAHPDVRDRAILYYRLLEHSAEEARRVICAPKEVVEEFQEEMDADFRDRVFDEFNTLSTIYKQPAAKFLQGTSGNTGVSKMPPAPLPEDYRAPVPEANGTNGTQGHMESGFVDMLPGFDSGPAASPAAVSATTTDYDLLGESLDFSPVASAPRQQAAVPASSSMGDLLGMDDLLGGASPSASAPSQVHEADPFALALDATLDGNTFQ